MILNSQKIKSDKEKTVKAVVFDMDGLILDTEIIYRSAIQKAAKEFGYSMNDAFYVNLVGRPEAECERAIVKHFGHHFPLDLFRRRWQSIWNEMAESGISVKPGFSELMGFLTELRMPKALATSTRRKAAVKSLKFTGLMNLFDRIVTGDEVVNGKPAPDIYLVAAQRLGVDPNHCVALEDSEAGIRSAHAAGMVAIMIPDLIQPSREIQAIAHGIVNSLTEAQEFIRTMIHPK